MHSSKEKTVEFKKRQGSKEKTGFKKKITGFQKRIFPAVGMYHALTKWRRHVTHADQAP